MKVNLSSIQKLSLGVWVIRKEMNVSNTTHGLLTSPIIALCPPPGSKTVLSQMPFRIWAETFNTGIPQTFSIKVDKIT